jgi:hypothetical protein
MKKSKKTHTDVFRAVLNGAMASVGGNKFTNTTSKLLVIEVVSGIGSFSPLYTSSPVASELSVSDATGTVGQYQFFGPVLTITSVATIHARTKIYVKPGETLTFSNPNGYLNVSGRYE